MFCFFNKSLIFSAFSILGLSIFSWSAETQFLQLGREMSEVLSQVNRENGNTPSDCQERIPGCLCYEEVHDCLRHNVVLIQGNERKTLTPEEEQEFVAVGQLLSRSNGSFGASGTVILSGLQLITAAHAFYKDGQCVDEVEDMFFAVRLPDGTLLEYDIDFSTLRVGDTGPFQYIREKDWATVAIQPKAPNSNNSSSSNTNNNAHRELTHARRPNGAYAAVVPKTVPPRESLDQLWAVNVKNPNRIDQGDPLEAVAYHGDLAEQWPAFESKRRAECHSREKSGGYQRRQTLIQYDCSTRPGSSGSPLFVSPNRTTVRAIAITSAGDQEITLPYELDSHFNLGVMLAGDFLQKIWELNDQIVSDDPPPVSMPAKCPPLNK